MNLLARLDPGDPVWRLVLTALVQATGVILVAALLAHIAFRRRAAARHGLWLGTLVWILLNPAVAVLADGVGLPRWAVALPFPPPGVGAAFRYGPRVDDPGPGRMDALLRTAPPAADHPAARRSARTGMPARAVVVRPTGARTRQAARAATPAGARWRAAVAGGVSLLWAAGVLLGLGRIALGWRRGAILLRAAPPLDPVRHGATLTQVRDALGVAALPPIVTSPRAAGPVAAGLLRPGVVLPEGLAAELTARALRDVLIHECAHVLRHDSWIGLLQRLAGVLYWPHPLVVYLNRQLARAREEVCDNYVLRCGDACGYARTLLALTESCRPLGIARAGLGVFGAHWTLADRVAGLLDPGRIAMTRTSFRMKIALAAALAATGLVVASVRLEGPARADEPDRPQSPKAAAAEVPLDEYATIRGVVVDEQGQPVAGAVVRRSPVVPAETRCMTAPDGTFALPVGGRFRPDYGLLAEVDGGGRAGLIRFDDPRDPTSLGPVRIIVKPARTVMVRVKDGAGAPVPSAAVEIVEYSFRANGTTGPDGAAALRVPADAKVQWVIGHKSGVGFDYFENYRTMPPTHIPPLPAEVTLTLDGAKTVRVKVVDGQGRPLPDAEVSPRGSSLKKPGKIGSVNAYFAATLPVMTDGQGVAVFDWVPPDLSTITFNAHHPEFFQTQLVYYNSTATTEPTIRLLRAGRLSGAVRFPDGHPARRVLIRTDGVGGPMTASRTTVTGDDGTYALIVAPEKSYNLGVHDDTWAAPSRMGVVVREGQAQGGIDFTLIKGTLVHGRVTEGSDHNPSAETLIGLIEQGPPIPKDFESRATLATLKRPAITDAEGHYHFRVGPGRYELWGPARSGFEPQSFEIKDEPEVVRDLALTLPARPTFYEGVVVERTPRGDRPIAGASVTEALINDYSFSHDETLTDDQGRFRLARGPFETVAYARSPDGSLAGLTLVPVTERADKVTVVVAPAVRVTGRIIDTNGKPLASKFVRLKLYLHVGRGPAHRMATDNIFLKTDEQGRFEFKGVPVGAEGELWVYHEKNGRPTNAYTAARFSASDTGPVEVPDLVVPPAAPTAEVVPRPEG